MEELFGYHVEEAISREPGPNAPLDLPIGSRSVELSYRAGDKDGEELARAHVYIKPGGEYGASGIPDPKRVLVGDTQYRLDKSLDPPQYDYERRER